MAEHKVPQDVEAEDKLLGPFSFRQFIYLMVAVGAGFLAFFLGRMAIPLAFIPLPVFALFGVLALPLRKDQPMETYLAAMIKFYFSPHVRLWGPDGQDNLVEISNPIVDDEPKIKDVGGDEAARRLSFLADIADTQGWATRGVGAPVNTTSLNDDLALAANDAPDILDNGGSLAHSLDDMLNQSGQQIKQAALTRMQSDISVVQPSQSYSPANMVNFSGVSTTPYGVSSPVATSETPPTNAADEAAAATLLAQAAATNPTYHEPIMQQKVIQPPSATPVVATPAPAPSPVEPAPPAPLQTPPSAPIPTPASPPTPEQPLPAEPVAVAIPPDESPVPANPAREKSDIIDESSDLSGEATINHAGTQNNDSEVEISLH